MLCEYSLHIRYKYTKSSIYIYIIYLYTHATDAVWVEDLTLWANLLPSVFTFIADWGFYTYIIFYFNCQVSVNIGHAPRSASSEYLTHATLSYQGKRCPNYSRNVSQAQSSSKRRSYRHLRASTKTRQQHDKNPTTTREPDLFQMKWSISCTGWVDDCVNITQQS